METLIYEVKKIIREIKTILGWGLLIIGLLFCFQGFMKVMEFNKEFLNKVDVPPAQNVVSVLMIDYYTRFGFMFGGLLLSLIGSILLINTSRK